MRIRDVAIVSGSYFLFMEEKNMELQNTKFNSFSNLITVIIVAAGVVGQALIYGLFGIEIQDVPVVTMIVLWVAISGIVYEVFRNFEE
jgi:hypothetical protein